MPRTVPSQWRNRKRGTYAIVGAFSIIIPFVLLSYYVFGQHPRISATLKFVSIIFRHGERTPTHFYPNDPYKDLKLWPDGIGALTKRGKQQMYRLGRVLRERYGGFLSETYSPEDIYVMSSDHDRCLMSAQLCLAGLYPPVGRQIWNSDLAWQPVPVHTVPKEFDKLLVVKKPCPRFDMELNKTYSTSYFIKVNQENIELFKYLTEHSGMKVENIAQLETLFNTLEVEAKLNLKLPEWTKTVYGQKMKNLSALSLAAFTFTDKTKRLKGGPLLKEVVDHMTRKILGSLKPNRVFYMYSAHDLTIVSMLRALGFEELYKPDYGAAIIFELHQPMDGGDHLVELLYLNSTEESDPIRLSIPGCDEMCKVKNFLRITKPMIPDDWEAECQDI